MTLTHPLGRAALNRVTRERFRRHCRPLPKLTGSEWVERYLELPAGVTKRAGRVRLDVTPYLREVLDAATDRKVRQVTFIAPSQSAKTTFVLAVLSYYVHQQPSPILLVQPTVEMAEDFSKGRLTPVFESTPVLRDLIAAPRSRQSANTILSKQYPGGQMDFAGANSPAGLASRPKRIVMFDEVDRYPEEAGNEGDPIAIGTARTISYQPSEIVIVITSPTDEPEQGPDGRWSGSRGWREYLKGTQEVYEHQCPDPACGFWQVLDFDQLKWEKAGDQVQADSVHYPCAACGYQIDERMRSRLRHRWRATNDQADGTHRSFHLEGLAAAFAMWSRLAQEFTEVCRDPVRFKTFVNTKLGRLWKDRRIEGLKTALLERAKRYDGVSGDDPIRFQVPREAGLLTAGVDVQHDRLELVVRAWGVAETSWLIERAILRGDTSQPDVWERLDQYRLERTWLHESGLRLGIRSLCVDAGDGASATIVYKWCAPRRHDGVFPVKGHSEYSASLLPHKPTPVKPGKLWVIGVNGITDLIVRRLNATIAGAGYMHLNEYANDDYVTQLLAEERTVDPKTRKRRWVVRRGARNEVLDCEKYAYAALLLGPVPIASLADEVTRVNAEGERLRSAAAPVAPVEAEPRPAGRSWLGSRNRGGWMR